MFSLGSIFFFLQDPVSHKWAVWCLLSHISSLEHIVCIDEAMPEVLSVLMYMHNSFDLYKIPMIFLR